MSYGAGVQLYSDLFAALQQFVKQEPPACAKVDAPESGSYKLAKFSTPLKAPPSRPSVVGIPNRRHRNMFPWARTIAERCASLQHYAGALLYFWASSAWQIATH